ncbi:hypothetical protein B0H13DRAFT_1609137 [Mycena leptocephala]|nr:hypothetical protein B0H13DRAFT_1609137 [Mycena leptocephala]
MPIWIFSLDFVPFHVCRANSTSAGHMLQLILPSRYGDYEFAWLKVYGSVYRLKGCVGANFNTSPSYLLILFTGVLSVSDPLVLQYILNSTNFRHAPVVDTLINLLYGRQSVIGLEGSAIIQFSRGRCIC